MPRGAHIQNCGHRTLLAKTCSKCYKLKSSSEFVKRPDGFYVAWCNRCMGVKSTERRDKENELSRPNATKYYEVWTEKDIYNLWWYGEEGYSAREIAKILNRTLSGIYSARDRYLKDYTTKEAS